MANFTRNLRLVFADENKEFNVKCRLEDIDALTTYLIDYGIYAEEVVPKKPFYRKKYHVFGKEYTSMRDFAESNGLSDTDVYRFNNKFLGTNVLQKYKMMEYCLANEVYKHVKADSFVEVWAYLTEAKRAGIFDSLQLDRGGRAEICAYSKNADGRVVCDIMHIKEFFSNVKNIIDNKK